MAQDSARHEVVFETKWFQIVARRSPGAKDPHYLINTTDFADVVAVTGEDKLLLVRQFRPAVGRLTLEVPSGHIEEGETPEEAARKELLEETGYVADKFELLTTVAPAIGRFTNKMWCYLAADARPTADPNHQIEPGLDLVLYGGTVRSLLLDKDFCSSLSQAAVFAALVRGKLHLD
jgi:ADP-ribose pyrophosphatase